MHQHVDSEVLEKLIKANSATARMSGWRETGKKFKFALEKKELEQKIADLNASTVMLNRVRSSIDSIHIEGVQSSSSRTIARLANFLAKIRRYTGSLHSAISAGCSTDCHPVHRTNLYLEDRSGPLLKKKPLVTFKIELASIAECATTSDWHHAQIDILDDEQAQAPVPQ